ncbi:hypothetical protein [Amphritea japonica]|nr:hypothetical protein [Amphritea japonica]
MSRIQPCHIKPQQFLFSLVDEAVTVATREGAVIMLQAGRE